MAARGGAKGSARARPTNPAYDPNRVLSGSSLKNAATALTDLQTKPAISQLARQIAATNRQAAAAQSRVGGFYNQFGQQAQQALQQQQQIGDRTNQQLSDIGNQTQSQIGQAGQAAQQSLQPLVDKGLDGGSFARLAQEIAAQKGVAGQNAQTFRSFGATQGGNYQGLTAGTNAAGQIQAQDSLRQLGNSFAQNVAGTQAKMDDLTAQRGATFVKNLGALRDSERTYGLSRATLGLNTQRAASDVAIKTAGLQQRQQQFNITTAMKDRAFQLDVSRYGLAKAKDTYQRQHGLGPYAAPSGKKALTQVQVNDAFSQIDAARTVVAQLRSQGNSTAQIRQALANGYYLSGVKDKDGKPVLDAKGVPLTKRYSVRKIAGGGYGTYANAALDLVFKTYLSPANIRALHAAGLKIGKRYPTSAPPQAVMPPLTSPGNQAFGLG